MSNGKKETAEAEGTHLPGGGPMLRRVRQPMFEKDIMSPGVGVEDTLTMTYFPDELSLNNAVLYIAQLEMFGLDDEKRQALYKINGNKAIHYLGTKFAVQAHGGLFWDSEASKEDKQYLSRMQERHKREETADAEQGQ